MRYRIKYEDTTGNPTERIINVVYVSQAGLLVCRCELRQARRTFHPDRIRDAIDMDTGEVLQGADIVRLVRHADQPRNE